jgi:hypothetical protein
MRELAQLGMFNKKRISLVVVPTIVVVTSSSPQTVTLDRLTSSENFTVDWGDGNIQEISSGITTAITHEYATAGQYNILFSMEDMSYISFPSRGLSGDISGWVFSNILERIYVYGNSFEGDASGWVLPSTLRYFYVYGNSELGGDISGWTIPSAMQNFFAYSCDFEGSMSGWVLLGSLGRIRVAGNRLSGVPDYSNATSLNEIELQDNGMSQEDVDANLQAIYENRAIFTNATPVLEIHGTNAAPSGIYQDATPPTTGKEYIYKLENDPDLEGFNTWNITYNT